MKKKMNYLVLMVLPLTLCASLQAQDCTIVKDGGRFAYTSGANEIIVVIDGDNHTEIHANGELKSTLRWSGDCEYVMTINEVTIPDFPFEAGAQVSVVINTVEDNLINYTCTLNGESWTSVMVKKEE